MSILEITWLTGFLACTVYHFYQFNQSIKILGSFESYLFCVLGTLADISKSVMWFVIIPCLLLQQLFLKGVAEDFNREFEKVWEEAFKDEED